MGCRKKVRLSDVAELTPGFAFKSTDFGEYSHKAIKITNISREGYSDTFPGVDIDAYPAGKLDKYLIGEGDYYLAMTGSIGKVGRLVRGSAYLNQRVLGLKAKSQIDADYLWFVLNSADFHRHLLTHIDSHSVQANISAESVGSFEFDLPPMNVQLRIGFVLGSFDKKIIANNRINGYLTQLALCLYEDFRNRADGVNGTLGDLVSLQKNTIKAGQRDDLPYMPIDDIPMKSIAITELRPNEEAKSSLQTFNIDDIVVGAMRVYFHRVVLAPCEGITRNTCFVLRPHNESMREYALLTCFQESAIEYANVRSKGSTMPYAVWKDSFDTYPVLIPSEQALNKFSKQVAPIINRIRDSYFENKKLMDLRDALLPKLMSGEIDVSKVEVPTPPNSHLCEC